ncbi:hypothetical protein ACFLXE_08435 [Chloroflexota bacterium]
MAHAREHGMLVENVLAELLRDFMERNWGIDFDCKTSQLWWREIDMTEFVEYIESQEEEED